MKSIGCLPAKIKKFDENFYQNYNEDNDPDYLPSEQDTCLDNFDTFPMNNFQNEALLPNRKLPSVEISARTRSQLVLSDISIKELESKLKVEIDDNAEPSRPVDPDDFEWIKWLSEFKSSDFIPNENLDDLDEDFTFTYDDMDQEDDEEYREDKAVLVTDREVKMMLNALEEEEIDFCIKKNRPRFLSNSLNNFPSITEEDEQILIAHTQQYVQLLVQIYMFGTFYKELSESAADAKNYLREIHQYTPNSLLNEYLGSENDENEFKPLTIFSHSNIFEAMRTVEKWDEVVRGIYTPVLFGNPPGDDHAQAPKTDFHFASILTIKNWKHFNFPPLPIKMMAFFLMEKYFAVYPCIIPTCGLKFVNSRCSSHFSNVNYGIYGYLNNSEFSKENQRIKFSKTELFLLIMGYFQFGENYLKIHLNVLPTRLPKRIKSKFRYMIQNPSRMNYDVKMMLMRGHVNISLIHCDDIVEIPSQIPVKCLARALEKSLSAPSWINFAMEYHCWKPMFINYNSIKNTDSRANIMNTAIVATAASSPALIPNECFIVRNTQFDIDKCSKNAFKGNIEENCDFKFEAPGVNESTRSSLNTLYDKIGSYYSAELKIDKTSLSDYLCKIILDLFQRNSSDEEWNITFLRQLNNLPQDNPSTILSKLITQAKNNKIVLDILAFIFGIREKATSYRFWIEFVQIVNNYREIEVFFL
uniref:GON-4-like protein (Trinotate prediction) n=1 Tax=Myxobolus squamalis TaxID=59785 RepID=A0A6B2G2J2_MYXSQ